MKLAFEPVKIRNLTLVGQSILPSAIVKCAILCTALNTTTHYK